MQRLYWLAALGVLVTAVPVLAQNVDPGLVAPSGEIRHPVREDARPGDGQKPAE